MINMMLKLLENGYSKDDLTGKLNRIKYTEMITE